MTMKIRISVKGIKKALEQFSRKDNPDVKEILTELANHLETVNSKAVITMKDNKREDICSTYKAVIDNISQSKFETAIVALDSLKMNLDDLKSDLKNSLTVLDDMI